MTPEDLIELEAIKRVKYAYARCLDLKLWDEIATLFTEDADQLGRLGVELAALPIEQRRAVLLATLAGRTAGEIAVIDGIPLGTAKTRMAGRE